MTVDGWACDRRVYVSSGTISHAFDGGAGIDTAIYSGKRADFSVLNSGGSFIVSGAGAVDTLVNVERLQFGDSELALDVDGSAGQAYRLYRAAIAETFITSEEGVQLLGVNPSNDAFLSALYKHVMHRPPDGDGYNFWLDHLNAGRITQAAVLGEFSESPENQAQVIGTIEHGFEYALWQG